MAVYPSFTGAGSIAVCGAMGGKGRLKPSRPATRRATSNFYDDPNFDHLISRQVKVRAGPLGYLFQEYEEAFAPERHAR